MSKIDFQNGFALGFAANGAGEGSSTQPDYLQNDPNAKDYIKNRPFYSISEEKTIAFTSTSFSNVESVGLVEGEVYNCYLSEPSGQKPDIELTAINAHSVLGIQAVALVYPDFYDPAYAIVDKVSVSDSGDWTSDDNSTVVIAMSDFWVNGLFGEVKKIDNKYLPENKLPIASGDTIGGIRAFSVTGNPSATQAIYINPDTGRLYTNPGKEYSTARPGTPGLLYTSTNNGLSSTSGYRPVAMHQLTGELYSRSDKTVYQYGNRFSFIPNYDNRKQREVSITKELNGNKYAAVLKITIWTHEIKDGVITSYSYAPTNYSYADILEGSFYTSSEGEETFTKIIYEVVDGNVYEDALITAQSEKIPGSGSHDRLVGFSTKLLIISSDEEAIDTLVSSLNNHFLIQSGYIRIYFQTSYGSPIEGDV